MRPSLRPRGSEQLELFMRALGVALSFPTSIAATGEESGYDDAQSFALAPMVGGIGVGSAFILELLLYPAIYAVWRERHLNQELERHSLEASGFVGPLLSRQRPRSLAYLEIERFRLFLSRTPHAATQLNRPRRCCSLVRK